MSFHLTIFWLILNRANNELIPEVTNPEPKNLLNKLMQKQEEKLPGYQQAHLVTPGTLEAHKAKSEMSLTKETGDMT